MHSDQNGSITLELLIAYAVFLIVLPPVLSLSLGAQSLFADSKSFQDAYLKAEQVLDQTRALARSDFNRPIPFIREETPYKTVLKLENLNAYTLRAEAVVSWNNSRGQIQSLSLNTLLTDWPSAVEGEACLLSGDWGHMEIIESKSLDANNPPTDLAVRGNHAYVTTNATTASSVDFQIFDLSNPQTLVKLSQLDTGPGLSSIRIAGNRAYVGNTSINGQLQIIDITNPRQPVLLSTYKLPGNYSDNTTIANQLAYADSRIYLGTQKSQIAELHIIDVSNPLSPFEIGNFEIDAAINDLAVSGNKLFVATPANEEVKVLDHGNPSNIHYIGGFDAPGGSGNGKSLDLIRNTVYVGRTLGGQEFYVLESQNPTSPQILGNANLNITVNDIATTGGLAFLATPDGLKELQAWDVSNSQAPRLTGTLNLPGTPEALACGSTYLYAAVKQINTLMVIKN